MAGSHKYRTSRNDAGTKHRNLPLRLLLYAWRHPLHSATALIFSVLLVHFLEGRLHQRDKQLSVASVPAANQLTASTASIPLKSKFSYTVRVRDDGIQAAEHVTIQFQAPHGITLQKEEIRTEPPELDDDIKCTEIQPDKWTCEIRRIDEGETIIFQFLGSSTIFIPVHTILRARVWANDWFTRQVSRLTSPFVLEHAEATSVIKSRFDKAREAELSPYRLIKARVSDDRQNFQVYSDQESIPSRAFPSGRSRAGEVATRTAACNFVDEKTCDGTNLIYVPTIRRIVFWAGSGRIASGGISFERSQHSGILKVGKPRRATPSFNQYAVGGLRNVESDLPSPRQVRSKHSGRRPDFLLSGQNFPVVSQQSSRIPLNAFNRNIGTRDESACTILGVFPGRQRRRDPAANAVERLTLKTSKDTSAPFSSNHDIYPAKRDYLIDENCEPSSALAAPLTVQILNSGRTHLSVTSTATAYLCAK